MTTKQHLVLLGDSIFDNRAYVGKGPAVIDQVSDILGEDWETTLLAVDGHVTSDVVEQLEGLPASTTHLAISVGGNDGLNQLGILETPVATVGEAILQLAMVQETFDRTYTAMLDAVLRHRLPTVVCTIYDPNFSDPLEQRTAVAALATFNDCITRAASTRGLPVIDLRTLFCDASHYANPIEPAPQGGQRIAAALKSILTGEHSQSARTRILGRLD